MGLHDMPSPSRPPPPAQTLVTSLVMGIPISCSLTQPDSYYAMPKSMVAVRRRASGGGRGQEARGGAVRGVPMHKGTLYCKLVGIVV